MRPFLAAHYPESKRFLAFAKGGKHVVNPA